ncbi:MAG: signal peptide peptidase SppA [Lachnospiraceae bacterium]
MNKKQTTWFIVAAVIFVVTGVISVITNAISNKISEKVDSTSNNMNAFMQGFTGELEDNGLSDMPTKDFIAVVPVRGTIQASSGSNGMSSSTDNYDHDFLMSYVDELIENDANKGIILRMDTPGGTVYEADELYLKLEEYKEKTKRPIWAYMESTCCSGGVYIASSADEQYANRNTTTGSIGVIISTYNMTELYKKLGIEEINIVSDKNKDMGSAGKRMTAEQKEIYQSVVDEAYEQFVDIVAKGRNMSVEEVKKLADGRIYTARQAVENGLIDGIKGSEEFDAYVKEQSGIDTLYEPESMEQNYFSLLFGQVQNTKEKSEAEVLVELMNQLGSGVPMYYGNVYGN